MIRVDWPTVPEGLDKLRNTVALLISRGRYREAVPVAERLLALTGRGFGQGSPETAEAMGHVGLLYSYLGVQDLAEHHYKQALAILAESYKLHPERGRDDLRPL